MRIARAIQVLVALADGVDPVTRKALPPGSPYHQAEVLRALFLAIQTLERQCREEIPPEPVSAKAGKPWLPDEDAQLLRGLDLGRPLAALARQHGRTPGAIVARLVRLGRFPTRDDARAALEEPQR